MSEDLMNYGQISEMASRAAHNYLRSAVQTVNEVMGEGAAAANPALVAAVLNATSTEYLASMLSHRVRPGLDGIADAIRYAGDEIRAGLSE